MSELLPADPYSSDLVLAAPVPDLLRLFNSAGVLAPADVHLAVRLMALVEETDDRVALAVALAGRGPRVGHVSVDLGTVRESVVVAGEEADLDLLPWPDPAGWVEAVAGSGLVSESSDGDGVGCRPLHLAATQLYLDRYWRDEVLVAGDLLDRAAAQAPAPEGGDRLDALFPGPASRDQRAAASVALAGRLTIIAGGPGTGKTTTVARLLALLIEEAAQSGRRVPLVGLAAPTGKAAARMEEAIRGEAPGLAASPAVRGQLEALSGVTLHRLLGTRPGHSSRFRHHRGHQLPHDVVVVDEASMVSLALMARLLEAVRPDARLILVGDPEQLVSVEAGAVLADIVGPLAPDSGAVAAGPSAVAAGPSAGVAGAAGATGPPAGAAAGPLAGRIALLRTNHRFSGALADLAAAIRAGQPDRTIEVLASGGTGVAWLAADASAIAADPFLPFPQEFEPLRHRIMAWASGLAQGARAGRTESALQALREHRLLCAHRDGPAGVAAWNARIERWLSDADPAGGAGGAWYAGRPVMVTANDYGLHLFNGDTGVVVAPPVLPASPLDDPDAGSPGPGLTVAFPGPGGSIRAVSPYRLPSADTVYATTVHKSQGSEFERVSLVLPGESSRLLTRELLYTAVTRARQEVLVVGDEASVRRAVERPLARASGLAGRLWAE